MEHIVKQPNGKYCLFSNVVDNITYFDLSPDQIVDVWTERSRKSHQKNVREVVSLIESGQKPYFQFTQTFDEVLNTIKEVHGGKEKKKIIKLLNV